MGDLLRGEQLFDFRVVFDGGTEVALFVPGAHGFTLDDAVGVFAEHARGGNVEQNLTGEDETAGGFEVAFHAFGVDAHAVDEPGGFRQKIVGKDTGIGKDHTLDGGVGDVAFVPEGDVLEGSLCVGADDAGETTDLLADDGVALVGHGGTALLLTFGEGLFGFADFCSLQVSYFEGDFLTESSDEGEGGDEGGVAVAGDDLAGDGGGLEAEDFADAGFVLGEEVGEGADGAGEFAEAEVFGGGAEAEEGAAGFVPPEGEFKAEGDGFGVDAVGASDGDGVLELVGAALEDVEEAEQSGVEKGSGFFELEGLGGVYHIVRSESEMEPPGGFAGAFGLHGFGDSGGEGDDVVADFAFDFEDAFDLETGVGAEGAGGGGGDFTAFAEGVGGGEFDVEPLAVLVFVTPDVAHFGAGVACDHRKSYK